ncbi:MAG: carboxypeptidase-like regulatory domain-containing protein [Bacteroidia bacterium]|nr:carboxypeptidase-like regulatory domain-containing protein [Bacteroidia bacterium]
MTQVGKIGWACLIGICLQACKKEAGEGGLASIKGKVYGYDINSYGVLVDSGYVGDYRVSISYGDHAWFDDDTRTSPSGDFVFQGLQKGRYRLTVYSQCDTCAFNQTYSEQWAEISTAKQEVEVPDFVIFD